MSRTIVCVILEGISLHNISYRTIMEDLGFSPLQPFLRELFNQLELLVGNFTGNLNTDFDILVSL
jgi:hypothetical protein